MSWELCSKGQAGAGQVVRGAGGDPRLKGLRMVERGLVTEASRRPFSIHGGQLLPSPITNGRSLKWRRSHPSNNFRTQEN